ncbi:MAG: thiamine pyrophosphate-binding protein, partial [Alphaproteobacteria bacterium]|nr:thiamine pyrophosphate-binding protein [Alphaproteobacteria bacterium]
MNGGEIVAEVLAAQGVRFLFTLSGGHIAPILVACKRRGIRIIDTRHEVTAAFAADGVSRLTGVPGVAAVTAGPGVTNTITAVKNAQLAQSPLIVIGGAAATVLKGRGALQDIDQMALFRPHVKWAAGVRKVRELGPTLERAFHECRDGVPGPVFVEMPVDLLYGEDLVREMYGGQAGGGGWRGRLLARYLNWHVDRMFAGVDTLPPARRVEAPDPPIDAGKVGRAAERLRRSERPLLLLGSQAVQRTEEVAELAAAVGGLGLPVYLASMARGLLGPAHPLQMRHQRRAALKAADLVILAGVPQDFRLEYGRAVPGRTPIIAINRSRRDLRLNRRPALAVVGDPGRFIRHLAEALGEAPSSWADWTEILRQRDDDKEAEIATRDAAAEGGIDPVHLCRQIDGALSDDSLIVADGGDFIGTAAYTVRPRGPLSWLDPGPFGTLGVGAGFAIAAKLCRPEAEVWLLYGDGSLGYSLAEFDSFVRHQLPILAVVGNDASWRQIAREQVSLLG